MSQVRNVVLAVSGGVDSAVAGLLLKRKGFNLVGAFMKNWDLSDEVGNCSVSADLEDAEFTCRQLKIPFHEVNFVKEYWNEVFVNFTRDYQIGITPNPDVLCNKHIKFKEFLNHAVENLGADAIATGHYARTSFGAYLERRETGKSVRLLRGRDERKDQTFFLSQISREALQKTMFPLGEFKKEEVKRIACENGLERLARKPESMGICFIGSRNFQNFISEYVNPKPGKFINLETGRVEGVHGGIHLWTVGQRCKIGGLRNARYVAKKNIANSDILVAPGLRHPALYSSVFYTDRPHWLSEPPPDLEHGGKFNFKFQHVKSLSSCLAVGLKNGLIVSLKKPLRALTPGQYSVFYDGEECLGSARITGVGPSEFSLGRVVPDDYREYDDDEDD